MNSSVSTTHPTGIEAVELSPADAAEVLSDFAGLELVPIEADAEALRLQRAGFTVPPSAPSVFRDGAKEGGAA